MLKMKREKDLKDYEIWKEEEIKKIKDKITQKYKFVRESA